MKTEKERIESQGGTVINLFGIPRVNGKLAVSRALGDHYLRPYITAVPEVIF